MTDLSERQRQLLKAIIEIYVKSGEPVASEIIERTNDLGVSPATIRNEMAHLTKQGFLKQPHVSAGRIPTSMGFRLYISELMKEKEVPVLDEVNLRQQVLDKRVEFGQMVHTATKALAKKCGTLALSINDDDIYYTGAATMLDLPEFFDIDVTRFVLSLFDEFSILQKILDQATSSDPCHIVFGEETEYEYLQPTSFAFANFDTLSGDKGTIGLIGPARLNFPVVIPYLRYIRNILTEASRM